MLTVLGSAVTGAKFTPMNHRETANPLMDRICRGDDVPISEEEIEREAQSLYRLGCRYFHYHARNFKTREQTTDSRVYSRIGSLLRAWLPDMLVSFGASRNGSEVMESIATNGEWERVSQAALGLEQGGAHFVTTQAAIELQIICELERRLGRPLDPEFVLGKGFLDLLHSYIPSEEVDRMDLETNSTAGGGNYGSTSPAVQYRVLARAIAARDACGLLHEVEWVQFARSLAMTRMAVEQPDIGLGGNGRLNITILFGFSPRLPFPETYADFKQVVAAAKSLELDLATGQRRRTVTVSVGAAVLPQHAARHVRALDIGRFRGRNACALRRLATWAAQPDSGVDILRSGMEDTPYEMHPDSGLRPANNVRLCEIAAEEFTQNGGQIATDAAGVASRLTGWSSSSATVWPEDSPALLRPAACQV